jgi:hypothetical protein
MAVQQSDSATQTLPHVVDRPLRWTALVGDANDVTATAGCRYDHDVADLDRWRGQISFASCPRLFDDLVQLALAGAHGHRASLLV